MAKGDLIFKLEYADDDPMAGSIITTGPPQGDGYDVGTDQSCPMDAARTALMLHVLENVLSGNVAIIRASQIKKPEPPPSHSGSLN